MSVCVYVREYIYMCVGVCVCVCEGVNVYIYPMDDPMSWVIGTQL